MGDFVEPRRRASQTRAQVRMQLHRKRELKLSFKPDRRSIHGAYKMPKRAEGCKFMARRRFSEPSLRSMHLLNWIVDRYSFISNVRS
jgi:hypothetical protein